MVDPVPGETRCGPSPAGHGEPAIMAVPALEPQGNESGRMHHGKDTISSDHLRENPHQRNNDIITLPFKNSHSFQS